MKQAHVNSIKVIRHHGGTEAPDSPGVLGFMSSYYGQQVVIHQEVTHCRVTETKERRREREKCFKDCAETNTPTPIDPF